MNAREQDSLLPEGRFDQKFPLPSGERVRVRGLCKLWSPSPHSSPVKGEEVIKLGASNKSTRALLSLSPLIILIIFSVVFASLARIASAAEGTRFLVSYGGTAGYQLPLWVNKELGFSKKYGVDSGNHFDSGRLAEHSGLARRESSVNPNGSVFVSDRCGSRRASGDHRYLGKQAAYAAHLPA